MRLIRAKIFAGLQPVSLVECGGVTSVQAVDA